LSIRLNGAPASPGVAIGPAFLLDVEEIRVAKKEIHSEEEVERELKRFHDALNKTRRELETIARRVSDVIEGRQLIEVHMLLLNDPSMIAEVERRIRTEKVSAEYAVSRTLYDVLERFEDMEDPYLRSRSADIRDVGRRVIANLLGTEREALLNMKTPVILVSNDLDPSQTAGLSRKQLLGIVTDLGGVTSHTAILARSLGIPAVVGLKNVAEIVVPGQTVIIDGIHGNVILDPDPEELDYYTKLMERYQSAEREIARNADKEAVTSDGRPVELSANIEFSQEADQVRKFGGRGVGLFRTEFIKLIAPGMHDDEEMHFRAYRHVLEVLDPDPVIIRTLDLGGDKFLEEVPTRERNPFLGWRAIRICLDRPQNFMMQLRALLRAARFGNARIMLPLITHREQVLQVERMLNTLAEELDSSGIERGEIPPLGIMVETPAAALAIDTLLPVTDFVSIGTNDLTQYTLAVDRGSPYVSKLFDSFHPAVVRQLELVIRKCREAGTWVGVCGQMAAEPLAIPLLIGFGVDELSVATTMIPDVKEMVRSLDSRRAEELAVKSLELASAEEIRSLVLKYVEKRYPEIILDEIIRSGEE